MRWRWRNGYAACSPRRTAAALQTASPVSTPLLDAMHEALLSLQPRAVSAGSGTPPAGLFYCGVRAQALPHNCP